MVETGDDELGVRVPSSFSYFPAYFPFSALILLFLLFNELCFKRGGVRIL